MRACGPLLAAGDCAELDAATQLVAGRNGSAWSDEAAYEERTAQWRIHAAGRGNPDVTDMWAALDGALAERDGEPGWGKDKRAQAVAWLGCAREMAMTSVAAKIGPEAAARLARDAATAWRDSGGRNARCASDGTLVWDDASGAPRTFARWIAEAERDTVFGRPVRAIGQALVEGVTLETGTRDGRETPACSWRKRERG